VSSERFGALAIDERTAYFEQVLAGRTTGARDLLRPADLAEPERRRLRENLAPVVRQMHKRRMNRYFELPPEERTAYLDELIDEMRRHAGAGPGGSGPDRAGRRPARRSAEDGPPPPGPPRGLTPERIKRHIESTSPEDRARFMQFHKAVRRRMEERGIEPPGLRRP
jgi:hypothetical protein